MKRRLLGLLIVGLAVFCVVTAVRATHSSPTTASRPDGQPSSTSVESTTRPTPDSDAPLVRPDGDSTATPARVRIPRLGIDSSLAPLRTGRGGELLAPRKWQQAGWFADGTRPGDVGPAVIAGHIDSPTGPAVFARLGETRAGDRIVVRRTDGGSVVFRVDRTEVAGKRTFPTRAVYGPVPDAQLRLITCDGPYVKSSGGYQDNFIVYATEVPA